MIRVLWVALALSLGAGHQAARADWLRAESERFIVYSEGNERALRDYVQKLEMFDRVMQYRSGIRIDTTPPRKLPIYLVTSRSGLLEVHPGSADHAVGTYFPTDEDIFAVAVRRGSGDLDGEAVLMHEYVHHFMLGHAAGAYPAWYVEGFAEYYMTADIDVRDKTVVLGGYNENRAYWIRSEGWLPLDVLLTKGPWEVGNRRHQPTYYPIAWLLTHWFFSDPTRREQLQAYLADVARGTPSVTAMESATGMTLRQLREALRRYTQSRLAGVEVSGQFPDAEIVVTRLSPAADDLLLINQRLKIGVPEADRAGLAQEVVRRAARHGDDPLALLATGHAGMHFGDRAEGESALQRLIELQPDHVEALQFLAEDRLRQAGETDQSSERTARLREAREYLARAYAASQNDYRTLLLMTELRETQPGFPNANDLLAMGLALDRAPQLASTRFQYATALARTGDPQAAIVVLRPLSNNPHGGGASAFATRMIEALEAGEPLPEITAEVDQPQINEPEPDSPTSEEPASDDETGEVS